MRKFRILALMLVLIMVLAGCGTGNSTPAAKDIVILYTNDAHCGIEDGMGYQGLSAAKRALLAAGNKVLLVDNGDAVQGDTIGTLSKGEYIIDIMNKLGYDVATPGNHEFDYGYAQLAENMKAAKFKVLCADVLGADGKTIFDANTIIEKGGVKIGFFGLETPEAQTKANPKLIEGLKFLAGKDGKELYACADAQVKALKEQGADLIVCLSHLGIDGSSEPYTSYDLAKNVKGIDFIIDGHSHSVITAGPNGEAIQSTGTAFANIGVITIDNATKKIESNELKGIWHKEKVEGKDVTVVDYKTRDEKVAAAAKAVKTFAKTNQNLEIKGGLMEGEQVSAAQVEAIASLPSREELLAQIAGAISGVARGLAVALNGVPSGLAQVTKAVADQKEAA